MKRRTAFVILLTFLLAACTSGKSTSNALSGEKNASNVTPPQTVTFHEVSLTVPEGWTVTQLDSKATCFPPGDKRILVGDPVETNTSCVDPVDQDGQIWLTSVQGSSVDTTTSTTIGNLDAALQDQSNANMRKWVVTVPSHSMQLTFLGTANDIRASLLNGVAAR